jgi:hypothetical protein
MKLGNNFGPDIHAVGLTFQLGYEAFH